MLFDAVTLPNIALTEKKLFLTGTIDIIALKKISSFIKISLHADYIIMVLIHQS